MTPTNTTEKDFQKQILEHFWNTWYEIRKTNSFDKETCLDTELVLNFVKSSQKRMWEKYVSFYGENASKNFISKLNSELNKKGTIHILKNGFKDSWSHFKLFFPKPNNARNPELFELYSSNIFSVIEELEYEKKICEIE